MTSPAPTPRTSAQPTLARRRLFAGATAAGAAAAVAASLPLLQAEPAAAPVAKPAPEVGGGYQLTAHVQRYYDTTRV